MFYSFVKSSHSGSLEISICVNRFISIQVGNFWKKKMFKIIAVYLFLANCVHIKSVPLPQYVNPTPIVCVPCCSPCVNSVSSVNSNVPYGVAPTNSIQTYLYIPSARIPIDNLPEKELPKEPEDTMKQLESNGLTDIIENSIRSDYSLITIMSKNEADFQRRLLEYFKRFTDKSIT